MKVWRNHPTALQMDAAIADLHAEIERLEVRVKARTAKRLAGPTRPHWFWEMLASIATLGAYESTYERERRQSDQQASS